MVLFKSIKCFFIEANSINDYHTDPTALSPYTTYTSTINENSLLSSFKPAELPYYRTCSATLFNVYKKFYENQIEIPLHHLFVQLLDGYWVSSPIRHVNARECALNKYTPFAI